MYQFLSLVYNRLDNLTNKVKEVKDRLDVAKNTLVEPTLVDYLIEIRAKFGEDFQTLTREIGCRFSGRL